MVQKRVKAAKLHIYYEVGGQDLRITEDTKSAPDTQDAESCRRQTGCRLGEWTVASPSGDCSHEEGQMEASYRLLHAQG